MQMIIKRKSFTLLGRQYLYEGNYSAAAQHALLGLQQGDESFNALPGEEDHGQIGIGTKQEVTEHAIH